MAERAFARVLGIDPKHEALAFHGSVVTILSQVKNLEMFKQGVREMNLAVEHDPNSLTARLSRGITAQVLLEKIRSVKPNYNPVEDLEFVCHAFEGIHSHYAPQAEVGSKAFLGESYMLVGDVSKARSTFKAALALFDSEENFLRNPVETGIAEMNQSHCHWRLIGFPQGIYAVAIYQDTNGNGKLDRNMLGIPLEPYGFSNNAHGILGPPSFGDARFQVSGSDTRIEVNLE